MSFNAQVWDFLKQDEVIYLFLLLLVTILIFVLYKDFFVKNGKDSSSQKNTLTTDKPNNDRPKSGFSSSGSVPELKSFKAVKPLSNFSIDQLKTAIEQTEHKLVQAIQNEKAGNEVFGGIDPIESDLKKLKIYLKFREQKNTHTEMPSSDSVQNQNNEHKIFSKQENTEPSNSIKFDEVPLKSVTLEPEQKTPKPHSDMQDRPYEHYDIEKRLIYLEDLAKKQQNQIAEDILFCPASSNPEPMVKLRVDSEIIDISKAGSWYDGGELITILKRDKNFLSKLLLKKNSVVQLIEKGVSKQSELSSLMQQTCIMAQKWVETQNSEHQKRTDLYNARVVVLQKSADPHSSTIGQSVSHSNPHSGSSMSKMIPNPIGHINCPVSQLPMDKETFDGETIDVSPQGIWFDGRGHKGRVEPELISILKKKPGFFSSILGSDSVINRIEGKRDEVAADAQLQSEILETKKRIQSLSVRLTRQSHHSHEFSTTLRDVRKEFSTLDKLNTKS